MKKPITRTLGVLVLLAVLAALVVGCSDMIISLTEIDDTPAGADAAALSADDITFTSDDTFDAVAGDFTLPIAGEVNTTTTITWVSGNTDTITIVNETGAATVTRPTDADANVKLTATLTDAEDNTSTKTVTVTVLATTDAGNDAAALGTGDITFNSGDSAAAVTGGFTLPIAGEVNTTTTITWESGNTDVITIENGTATVTRPATENVEVNLTATITDANGKTSTKTIKVTIVAEGGSGDDGDGGGTSATGILDDTFNTSGYQPGILVIGGIGPGGGGDEEGGSIALDPDGNILVAGYATSTINGLNRNMALLRRESSGFLDYSFGGAVTHDIETNDDDEGYSMALDSDGNILVAGYSNNGTDTDMAIWRYTSDGSRDTTFGSANDGYVIHDNAAGGNGDDYAMSLAVNETTGQIWVTGYSDGAGSNGSDMAIWCYNSDGSLDTTFDTDGFLAWDGSGAATSMDYGRSILIDSEGKILVTGQSLNGNLGSDYQMAIWRYNSDGSLDATFGSSGVVTHDDAAGGNNVDPGQAIVLDSNGNILVAGISHNGSDFDMVIWRYNSDGSLDTTFGGTGFVVHSNAAGGNGTDYGMDIALDSAGKILVTGYSNNGSNDDMVIWRYNSDGTLDTTFGTDGIVISHNAAAGNGNDWGKSITLDSEGRILVTGYSDSTVSGKELVIWRYK